MICVIDRKNTALRFRAGCLQLYRKKKMIRSLPLAQLDQVVVYGNPTAETSVWLNLAEAGVPVVLLSARGTQKSAMLGSTLAVRLPLRRMQHRLADRDPACRAMAAWFIGKKIASYQVPLAVLTRDYRLNSATFRDFTAKLNHAAHRLDNAATVSEVMGVEGSLAQAWFKLLAGILPARYRFTGRNRRPPRDPVNSLLSLAYTMLFSEIRQGLLVEGFDTSLGFLHQEYPGREALALDFQEIFRTGVDAFVLSWLAHTHLDKTSFYYRQEEGCRLAKATRPLFYQAWALFREEWPRPGKEQMDHHGHIRELVAGQTAEARNYMADLLEKFGDI